MQTYSIRRADENDKDQILILLNRVFQKQQRFDWERDQLYWEWKYKNNIFGNPIINVAEIDGKIVGSSTLWPWRFTCKGKLFDIYQPCDTVVLQEYQGRGIFKKIYSNHLSYLDEMGVSFVFNFPNSNSLPGNLKMGWSYLGKIPWLVRPIKPFSAITSLKSNDKARPVNVASEHEIDPEICFSIEENQVSYDEIVRTYRPEGFYEWRYKSHPYFKYGMVITESGKEKAGAVFSINKKGSYKEMIVVDIFGNPELSFALFKEVVKAGKSYDVSFITAIFNPHFGMNKFWRLGFFKIRNKNMVVLPLDLNLENKLTDYANWSVIGGMHDSI